LEDLSDDTPGNNKENIWKVALIACKGPTTQAGGSESPILFSLQDVWIFRHFGGMAHFVYFFEVRQQTNGLPTPWFGLCTLLDSILHSKQIGKYLVALAIKGLFKWMR